MKEPFTIWQKTINPNTKWEFEQKIGVLFEVSNIIFQFYWTKSCKVIKTPFVSIFHARYLETDISFGFYYVMTFAFRHGFGFFIKSLICLFNHRKNNLWEERGWLGDDYTDYVCACGKGWSKNNNKKIFNITRAKLLDFDVHR